MPATFTCEHCGESFTRPHTDRTARFCSRSCKARARTGGANSHWKGGMTKHPVYGVYRELINRTTNPRHKRWADYGGRGITVCDRWLNDFWAFVADMGPRPAGTGPTGRSLYSLDRIDNDGPYEPGNCRWATYAEQAQNKRTTTTSRKAA